jgi:hypothetical protein
MQKGVKRKQSNDVIESTVRTGPMTTIQNILFPVDFSPSCIGMAAYVNTHFASAGVAVAGPSPTTSKTASPSFAPS